MHKGTQVTKVNRETVRVCRQHHSLTLAVRIDKLDGRHWAAYSELWENNQWTERDFIDQYASQAVALVEVGAWLERMDLATGGEAIREGRKIV